MNLLEVGEQGHKLNICLHKVQSFYNICLWWLWTSVLGNVV